MSVSSNMISRTRRTIGATDDPASLFFVDKPRLHGEEATDADSNMESAAITTDDDEGDGYNNRGIYYGCISCALGDLNYSMLVAFFPTSAKNRGLNGILIGLIFSVYQFANLCTCFFVPKVNRKYGGVKVLAVSNLVQAIATAAMAFTGYTQNKHHFFWSCFCLRAWQGSMAAFSEISASGIVMRSVPVEMAGEVVMYIESTRILGELGGPLVGGAVYGAFGFGGPFLFAAAILGTMSFLMLAFPLDKTVDNKSDDEELTEENKEVVKKYTRMVSVMCLFVCIVVVSTAFTIMEPTLQPYLKKAPYDLNSTMVGIVFISATMVFFLAAGVSERFILWLGQINSLMLGFAMIGVSFFFVAPPKHFDGTPLTLSAFARINSQVPATIFLIATMAVNWFGGGMLLALVNQLLVSEGESQGFTVTSISDAIGMILNIAFTAGATVGPFLGGLLTHKLDFPRANACFAFIVLFLAFFISIALHLIFKRRVTTPAVAPVNGTDDTDEEIHKASDDALLTNDPTKPLLDGKNII